MRHAAMRDRNDSAVCKRMRELGWLMLPVSAPGLPDYLAAEGGRLALVEVKVPGETFTAPQLKTFTALLAAGVAVYVLERAEDADRLDAGTLPAWEPSADMAIRSARGGRTKASAYRPGYSKARLSNAKDKVGELCATYGCGTSHLPGGELCAEHAGIVKPKTRRGNKRR